VKKIYFCTFFLLLASCADTFRMTYSVFIPSSPIRLEERLKTEPILDKNIQEPRHFAVLIGGNTEDRHRNNLSLAYQVLIEQGYKRKDVFIFDSEGGSPAIFPITDATNAKTIKIMFEWLANNVTERDSLMIYMTGHGRKMIPSNESAYVLNKAENLLKKDFAKMISNIHPNVGIVFGDFCYWGAFTESKGIEKYIFITATDDDHVSYGTTFGRAFWNSFRLYNKEMSVYEAYLEALVNDPLFARKDANHPSLSFFGTRPELFNILGEKIH